MGPYCDFCGTRCFLLRVLADGRSMLLATCPTGMDHDRSKAGGQDHTNTHNPVMGGTCPAGDSCPHCPRFTVQVEASVDGVVWQSLAVAETVVHRGDAISLAKQVAGDRTLLDGGDGWRVRVWKGGAADTRTPPATEEVVPAGFGEPDYNEEP